MQTTEPTIEQFAEDLLFIAREANDADFRRLLEFLPGDRGEQIEIYRAYHRDSGFREWLRGEVVRAM